MPSWEDFQPFIATGLALGGVYALSGVGLVVLYRTTGVLNLAFGAVGAMGALIAWELINNQGWDRVRRLRRLHRVRRGRHAALRRGVRPAAGQPRPARQGHGDARAGADPARRDVVDLERQGALDDPADVERELRRRRRPRQLHAGDRASRSGSWSPSVTAAFLRFTKLGTAMRALANDREITATLGVPVRRVEAAAWLGVGPARGRRRPAAVEPRRPGRDHADVPRHLGARGGADRPAAARSWSR